MREEMRRLPTMKNKFHLLGVCFRFFPFVALFGFCGGCARDVGRSTQRPVSSSNVSYKNKKQELSAKLARAAYWKKRGYNFDIHELTVNGMDMIAGAYSPQGWELFRANYYREEAEKKAVQRKAQQELDQVSREQEEAAASARRAERVAAVAAEAEQAAAKKNAKRQRQESRWPLPVSRGQFLSRHSDNLNSWWPGQVECKICSTRIVVFYMGCHDIVLREAPIPGGSRREGGHARDG
jgi:hypothetical protein